MWDIKKPRGAVHIMSPYYVWYVNKEMSDVGGKAIGEQRLL